MSQTTRSVNWRYFAEAIAVLSVVLSLIFVGYELRLSRTAATQEGLGDSADLNLAAFSLMLEHSDIWRRGCLGEELTPEERSIFSNVFGAIEHRAFITWNRAGLGLTNANPARFARTFALNRLRYPGFNQMWLDSNKAFSTNLSIDGGGWQTAVETEYQSLINQDALSDYDVAFCGRV